VKRGINQNACIYIIVFHSFKTDTLLNHFGWIMKLFYTKGIIIILIVTWLFSIGSLAIGDNSACADSQCHSDLASQYTTTSHAVCIDCHNETSTSIYPHTGPQISEPDDCSSCHADEVSTFSSSKHGYMKVVRAMMFMVH